MLKTLTKKQIAVMNRIRWWHRIPVGLGAQGEVVYTPGEVNHGPDGSDWSATRFGLPSDLTGKTVLDIGAWDGFFSFEAEKRGAESVLAADIPLTEGGNWGGTDGIIFAKSILGSQVQIVTADIDPRCNTGSDLSIYPGPADVVLCYGVLYHVKSPLTAIENLFLLTKPGGQCLIETARDPDNTLKNYAAWCFRPGTDGDPTNFWYPSEGGLRQALEFAGFTRVEILYDDGFRMTVQASRE